MHVPLVEVTLVERSFQDPAQAVLSAKLLRVHGDGYPPT